MNNETQEANKTAKGQGEASELSALLSAYWDAAYAEGAEGRTHDTEDGIAQEISSKLMSEISNCVEQAYMAGQFDAGVDPGYSNARAYRISLLGR